jgi:hypothetical protein
VTAGGKALNHAQLQFYKQQQLLRQQQQRLIRDHQLKVLQAQSASNQKVSVAVTAGTTMGIATVAGVTAVQVSQAQQQRTQVMVLSVCVTGSLWQAWRDGLICNVKMGILILLCLLLNSYFTSQMRTVWPTGNFCL